ncbi:hypothetical protein MPPM_4815 [Methylorubrum populi]|uniref:Uncharacterized protein n=2 Tax=Methylorubrum populi TaxID=223967 RepID=A0A160PMZ4_9HYPH|nr:hypothetical protein MPPM_4815 [Methylorubrum populi]
MTTAADLAFPRVGALVDLAERRSGSRMNAYDDVGRKIGATASWVRKFLGRQPIRLDADTFLNIHAAYRAECDRLEAQAELEWARFRALGEGDDAMAYEADRSLDGPTGGRSSHGKEAAALVAPLVDQGAK